MSKLGNVQESYGKQFMIAVANTYGENVLASTSLPKNTLIISSPVDSNGNDIGTYNMIITDNFGNPVRLTYTIQQGNGLSVDNSNTDILKLNIDSNTLKTNEYGELTINKKNVFDGNTIVINENNKVEVNTNNLTNASLNTLGVVKIDNNTIKTTTAGQIYVDTENLDRANDNQYGIVISDNNTVHINSNGVLSVNTQNLNKATTTSFGVVKLDGKTIQSKNNAIYVSTEDLTKVTSSNVGVAKVDGTTLTAVSGVISVNLNALTHASKDRYGLVKYNESIVVNDGIASVKDYDKILSKIEDEKILLAELQNSVNRLQDSILNNSLKASAGIYSFSCNDTTITNLIRPEYKEEPVKMKTQHVYVSTNIVTDCDFNISVLYENNETPAVELSQINYNDEFSYQGFDGLLKVFPSTNMKQKRIVFLFDCKNFKASTGKYEKTTKITITITSTKNKVIKKSLLYSVVRYNSDYLIETKDTANPIDKLVFIPVQSESAWLENVKVNPRRGYRSSSDKLSTNKKTTKQPIKTTKLKNKK